MHGRNIVIFLGFFGGEISGVEVWASADCDTSNGEMIFA